LAGGPRAAGLAGGPRAAGLDLRADTADFTAAGFGLDGIFGL